VYSSSDRWQVEPVQEVCTYVVTGVVGIFPRVAVIFLISFVEKFASQFSIPPAAAPTQLNARRLSQLDAVHKTTRDLAAPASTPLSLITPNKLIFTSKMIMLPKKKIYPWEVRSGGKHIKKNPSIEHYFCTALSTYKDAVSI